MPLKIFYLDDELDLCENFQEALSKDGCQVTTSTSSKAAVEICQRQNFDYIFLDYRLAEENGEWVAQKIGVRKGVFLMTGELDVATTYPFQQIIQKPFTLKQIRELLKAA